MSAPRSRTGRMGLVRLLILGTPILFAACLLHPPAPVSERSLVDGPTPDVYTVQKYDTLYSVAWRYELDVDALASRNRIKPPYVIHTGQRIALTGTAPPPPPAVPAAKVPVPAKPVASDGPVEPGKAAPESKPPPVASPAPSGKPVAVPTPTTSPPVAVPTPTTSPPAAPKTETQPPAVPTPAPAKPAARDPTPQATARPNLPPTVAQDAWRPPVAAKPTRRFGGGSKGFDYSLPRGTLIQAAASGVVVYAGPGLGGFRHLVIVKASDRHLVAYGVNVRPNLKEGDTVRLGDAVARAGSGSTGGQFHFEIRDRGKPVDPVPLIGS